MIHTLDHGPAHCHAYRISSSKDTARVKLEPVELWDHVGFKPQELARIMELIEQNQAHLLEVWDSMYPTR